MRHLNWRTALGAATVLGFLALLAPGAALAQPEKVTPQETQEKGHFDEPYFWGSFDETPDANDWFYDSYSYDMYDKDWSDSPWYNNQSFYSGLYNDNLTSNDWFYDAYALPSGRALF